MRIGRQSPLTTGPEVEAHPWEEIAEFFRGIVRAGNPWAQPTLALVEQVMRSPHRERLFAITSMHTLVVSGNTPFHLGWEVLRIDYDMHQGEFHFEYVEQPHLLTRWRKRCAPAEALGALEHLGRMKGWLPVPPVD